MNASVCYASSFIVEILKGTYKGHHLNNPVAKGTSPTNPHHESKITPTMAINSPTIILNNRSITPTLHFIVLIFYLYEKTKL